MNNKFQEYYTNLIIEIATGFTGNQPQAASTPGLYKSGNTSMSSFKQPQSLATRIAALEEQINTLMAQKQKLEAEYKQTMSKQTTPQQ